MLDGSVAAADADAESRQVQQGVDDQLTGSVIGDIPPPLDVDHVNALLDQLVLRNTQVFNPPAAPQGVDRGMLQHQDHIVCQNAILFSVNNGLLQFPDLLVLGQGQLDI